MLMLSKESPRTPEAIELLNDIYTEMKAIYPEPGAWSPFDPTDAEGEGNAFILARWNGRAVGCGVVRSFAEGVAEIKRLYVRREHRGKGFGRALLARLEIEAMRFGYARIVLETGTRQPEAIALYEAFGFQRIPCWGEYENSPLSLCYEKIVLAEPASEH